MLNQAPIPSHYLISCPEDYTAAPTTINPILRPNSGCSGLLRVASPTVGKRPTAVASGSLAGLLYAAVSYYFACEHPDETFSYMMFRGVYLDRILGPWGRFFDSPG